MPLDDARASGRSVDAEAAGRTHDTTKATTRFELVYEALQASA